MNVIREVCIPENGGSIIIFYTSFPYATAFQQIKNEPESGEKKCAMFTARSTHRFHLFTDGLTIKWDPDGSVRLFLHPGKKQEQIKALAAVAEKCNLSGIKVMEHFSAVKLKSMLKV